jgi:MFS family permease
MVGPDEFDQAEGPFVHYRRSVHDGEETIEYRLALPWFGWLYAPLVRRALRHRPHAGHTPGDQPWWAPRDRLDPRQVRVLGLLAAASMGSAFTNTLFTQTVHKAAEAFSVGKTGQGVAGGIVRAGIILVLPFAFRADRVGRRRIITFLAFAAPIVCALGALAPSFPALVATQTVGRPLGLAFDLLIAVVAAEEMPRDSRAYSISVLALASGLGAGMCVWLIPTTDLADWGWRIPYAATILWLAVAVSLWRHLPETARFRARHARHPRLDIGRLGTTAAIAACGNVFVAPASFFQNRYLDEVRGLSGLGITLFTITTATPAAIGLLLGGRIADRHGRRRVGSIALVTGTALVAASFAVGGPPMWFAAALGGIALGAAYPALSVYRAELFPTANRGKAGGLITTSALVGGIVGLVVTGVAVDHGLSYGRILGLLALCQVVVAVLVLTRLPESAHRELEELNPEDAVAAVAATR